ncbi:MAG: hypothetical protein ACKVW3_06720 [Phycisphaerales bacterium]
MSEWLQAISRFSEGKATRTTALQPLLWLCALLAAGFVGAASTGAALWVQIIFGSAFGAVVLTTVVLHCILLWKNPDLVRSESFVIRKMEIEQASIGDSDRGVLEQPKPSDRKLLGPLPSVDGQNE